MSNRRDVRVVHEPPSNFTCPPSTEQIEEEEMEYRYRPMLSPVIVTILPSRHQMEDIIEALGVADSTTARVNSDFHMTLAIMSKADWKSKRKRILSIVQNAVKVHLSPDSDFVVEKVVKLGNFVALSGDRASNPSFFALHEALNVSLEACGVPLYGHTSFIPHISLFRPDYNTDNEAVVLHQIEERLDSIKRCRVGVEKVIISDGTGKAVTVWECQS